MNAASLFAAFWIFQCSEIECPATHRLYCGTCILPRTRFAKSRAPNMPIEIPKDWFDREQLHFAADDGDLEKIRTLLASGCDINVFDDMGKTPLHYAVGKENIELVKCLLKSGADVNARCEALIGNTPLAEYAGTCSLELARVLIEAGADPSIRGWMQLCALDRAKDRKRGDGPSVHALFCKHSKRRSAAAND